MPGLTLNNRTASGKKKLQRLSGVRFLHKGFTDQEPVDMVTYHPGHIRPLMNTAFRDHTDPLRDLRQQVQGCIEGNLEGLQVPVVDPKQLR